MLTRHIFFMWVKRTADCMGMFSSMDEASENGGARNRAAAREIDTMTYLIWT